MIEWPTIPGYKILRELGSGGMATVYLAVQEKLNREVAVKVLAPVLVADRQFAARFMKEAEMAGRMHHAGIIPIFDVGQAGQYVYIVMEYLPESLKDRIRKGPVEPSGAMAIVSQLAKALSHAHREGYIHRDIKPENVMFRKDGTVVLVDFGIARAVGTATRLTKTGMSVGTPHYMSPEQARGLELDGRADLYSLGVVFYEMLTGRVPYDAEDSVAVAIKHIQEPVPELPPNLRRYQPLLDRLLAKDREERVGSGEELIQLIVELGVGEAGVAGRASRRTERVDLGSQRVGRTPPSGARGVRIAVGRTGLDGAGSGSGEYGEEASRAPRSWVVPTLAGILVVAVGALLYLLSVGGGPRPESPLSAPSMQIEPARPGERPSGTASSPSGKAVVKTSWEEAAREREFGGYLTQARVLLAKGSLEEAQTNVELAESIRKGTAEAESLKRLIADAETARRAEELRREQKRRDDEAARLAAERDESAWAEAVALGTEEAYRKYLASHPSGRNASEARHRLGAIQAAARAEEERRRQAPSAGQVWREAMTGMEFVWVPAGEFMMGSNAGESDEKPVHRVRITKGFWMGKYEVTQGQWRAIMGDNPARFQKGDNYPVEQVSWNDAQEFINRLNSRTGQSFRLPMEAEWEYACHAGTTGESYGNLDSIAWYSANSGSSTQPVGRKQPNAFGLYDMLGNVWEWAEDWYDSGYYGRSPIDDPPGPSSGSFRVFRGGSWSDVVQHIRAAFRYLSTPSDRNLYLGFRLARTN